MNNIKAKRLQEGYKQYKIAQLLNISTRHYARLENDERFPKQSELIQLSKIFNCAEKELKGDF